MLDRSLAARLKSWGVLPRVRIAHSRESFHPSAGCLTLALRFFSLPSRLRTPWNLSGSSPIASNSATSRGTLFLQRFLVLAAESAYSRAAKLGDCLSARWLMKVHHSLATHHGGAADMNKRCAMRLPTFLQRGIHFFGERTEVFALNNSVLFDRVHLPIIGRRAAVVEEDLLPAISPPRSTKALNFSGSWPIARNEFPKICQYVSISLCGDAMEAAEAQTVILRLLKAAPGLQIGYFITDNAHALCNQIRARLGIQLVTQQWDVFSQAFWELIARRLIFIGGDRSLNQCRVWLTERGQRAANGEQFNPEDPTRYMERLLEAAPRTSDTTQQYLREALKSYEQECFLASSVMLGGAAEDTSLDVAASFVSWQGKPADNLKAILENPKQFYVYKLQQFEKRLTAAKGSIPPDLSENIELNITTILQLIRLTRNDAGHPTGRRVDQEDCYQNLVVYANAHRKLHRLKVYFDEQSDA